MTATVASRSDEDRVPRWAIAVLLTVLWHLLVLGSMTVLDPFAAEPAATRREPIDIVFTPTAPTATPRRSDDALPRNFTELPEDRADQAPENPDALSNVDSRARDRADDGPTTDLPRSEGRADNPSVSMAPAPPPGQQGIAEEPPETPADALRETPVPDAAEETAPEGEAERLGRRAEIGDRVDDGQTGGGRDVQEPALGESVGNPRDALVRGPVEVSPAPRFRIGAGRDEIVQEGMRNPTGNAQLFGDISLNTVAWDWAPWLQRFTRDFYRSWVPPYAYFLGLIDGNHLVEVEIAPDGRLLKLEVLDETGHESLREATLGNFRGLAPYQPLPEDFPEPTLRMTVRVTYYGRE